MLQGYCDFLAYALKVPVPLTVNRPVLYLSAQEKKWQNQVAEQHGYKGAFWIVNAGTKRDFTAKQYPHYQKVIDLLAGKVVFVQMGKDEHLHRPLDGAYSLVERTDDRQLIRLFSHCAGYLGPVSFGMHLAAAFQKPAVILAGGREPRSWNTYPKQSYLSSVGMLDCCRDAACWKSRTIALHDGAEQDASVCAQPVPTVPWSPRCLALWDPETVAGEILRYHA
jgi:ADP-heptose:LPS heptosyltransferase